MILRSYHRPQFDGTLGTAFGLDLKEEEENTVQSYQKLRALTMTHVLSYAFWFTLLYAALKI